MKTEMTKDLENLVQHMPCKAEKLVKGSLVTRGHTNYTEHKETKGEMEDHFQSLDTCFELVFRRSYLPNLT